MRRRSSKPSTRVPSGTFPHRRLRRHPPLPPVLHGFRQADPARHRHPDAGLRQVPAQRPAAGYGGGSAPHPRRGPVQRRYSAIRIALGLAEAFDCSVNELPLSIILCWFEQKAVCVLMALLALASGASVSAPPCPPSSPPGWPLFCRRSMTSGPSPRRRTILPPVWAVRKRHINKSPRHDAERAGGLFVQSGGMRKLSALGGWLFSGAARCVQNRPLSALRSHRSG